MAKIAAKGTTANTKSTAPAPSTKKAAHAPAVIEEDTGFLDAMDGEGTESIGAGDTSSNYLKLAQSNTPEIVERSIEGLSPGMFFDSLTKTVFGSVVNLIVMRYEVCWNVWAPRERGGGLINRCAVGGMPVVLGDRGKMYDHEGNTVAETQNYHVIIEGHDELGIFILSCSSTMLKYGRKWNTLIQQLRTPNGLKKAPIFQGVWQVEAVLDSNSQGKWYNIGTKNVAAIEHVRNINREDYEAYVQDAFEVCSHIPRIALGGTQNQLAIDDSTLDNV